MKSLPASVEVHSRPAAVERTKGDVGRAAHGDEREEEEGEEFRPDRFHAMSVYSAANPGMSGPDYAP
eukprot:520572-Rhodomonas_salina.3